MTASQRLELAIFFWAAIAVCTSQFLLLTWFIWPKLRRRLTCAWCWRVFHVERWLSHRCSSNICAYHERRILAEHAAMRQAARRAQAQAALAETVELEEVTL